jgi:hypothetical protein
MRIETEALCSCRVESGKELPAFSDGRPWALGGVVPPDWP